MTKESNTMKEGTPKITNRLHTQERTKGNKIAVEEGSDEELGGGACGVGLWPCSPKKKGNNEGESNNNQVICCYYHFLHTREEIGE